jgi:phosphonate transport system permease protein
VTPTSNSFENLSDLDIAGRAEVPVFAPAARRRARASARRWAAFVIVAATALVVWHSGIGRREVVNQGGWTVFRRFWVAAAHPDLSPDLLRATWRGALVTVSFAVVGSAVAVMIGLVGGVLLSERWWRRSRGSRLGAGWYVLRSIAAVPRGVHEAVFALILVNVLGRDPLVGIAALAIPFGAITAKVFADLIDAAPPGPYEALRATGSGRVTAMVYAVFPLTARDMVSYGFYRLECAIRSAVILGMIGAGGIGFELALRFQSLKYRQMWTLIYALVVLSAMADLWGSALRRRAVRRRVRLSIVTGIVLVIASIVHLRPDFGRLFRVKTRRLASELIASSWPPAPPRNGWWGLGQRMLDTLSMSFLSIVLSAVLAAGVVMLAARPSEPRGLTRRVMGVVTRLLLVVVRAIPAPVWALLVLFIVFPGPVPGAVALGIYNFGVLGRLWAEAFENLDRRPLDALRALGASQSATMLYGTLPLAAPKFTSFALYRWEVAVRETVIVGVVGAGGLGRLLEQQRAAFDYRGMFATVLALIAVAILVDAASTVLRRAVSA